MRVTRVTNFHNNNNNNKKAKYSAISTDHLLILVAIETMGSINHEGLRFLKNWEIALQKFQRTHESTRFSTNELVLLYFSGLI